MKTTPLFLVCAALLATIAAPAEAEIYTVTLTNGASLETRYQPITDPHDESKLLMLTDQSNWISLPLSIVASVTEEYETRGFGLRIDSKTVEVGYLPNDQPDPNAETAPEDPTERLLRALEGQREEPFTVEQFVQPTEYGEPGEASGGIPIGFTRRTTPPLGRPFD